MLRKSLQVLAAIVLLGLAFTVGFAFLGLGGPQKALAEADAFFARGEYQRAIAVLDLAERNAGLRADRQLHERLLRCRMAAHQLLGNPRRALDDLQTLLREHPEDAESLQLDHVRLLAMTGDGQRALAIAEQFLQRHPTDGRALELAGEAAQTLYQEDLRAIVGQITRDAGRRDGSRARADLLSYLYRPSGDERIPQALQRIAQLYRSNVQLMASWPALERNLIALRGRIQDCLRRFEASIEADGEPVAAFRALCLSLDQAERTDDLLLLCEAYRRRFDHQYVLEAGTFATWALIRKDQLPAALVTAARWLPKPAIDRMIASGVYASTLPDFLTARAFAAWRLRDKAALQSFAQDVGKLNTAKAPLGLASGITYGLLQHVNGNHRDAENSLRWVTSRLLQGTVPVGQVDLLPDLVRVRAELARARAAGSDELTAMFQEWVTARPGELAPLLALANHQLAAGQASAAVATLSTALELAPFDELLLERRLAAARRLYQDTDQDGAGLLAQCVRRHEPLPEVADPLGYLLCAEAALAAGDPRLAPVALACAHRAIDHFAWSQLPRQLEARAELLAGRPRSAAAGLDPLLRRADVDRTSLELSLQARQLAGQPLHEVVVRALGVLPPGPAMATATLRSVPPTALAQALPFATTAARFAAELPELAPLCAAVFAAAGDGKAADALLDPLRGSSDERADAHRLELATAVLLRLTARRQLADEQLARAAERDLADFGLRHPAAAPALLATAAELADDRPRTALALLAAGLANGGAASRSGAAFTTAGSLALRAGERLLAEQHWTAALAFADGRDAVEPLARLCLADDRVERAAQVYTLLGTPTDLGLALRFGQRTPRSPAEVLARQRLAADRTDLLAQLALAVIGVPTTTPLQLTLAPQLDRLCEILAVTADPELAAAAIEPARALLAARPTSRPLRLLLSHTLAAGGQPAAAAQLHEQLFAERADDPMLFGAAARAAASPDYTMPTGLAEALRAAVAAQQLPDCPAATAFAMRYATRLVEQAGNAELAGRLATQMWVDLPRESGATLADAQAVAARGEPLAAWWILERLGPSLTNDELPAALRLQTGFAQAALRTGAGSPTLFYDAALRQIDRHGPRGALVHFVLEVAPRLTDRRLPEERAVELLQRHLAFVATDRVGDSHVAASVRELLARTDLERTAQTVQNGLLSNPACLPLWLAHCELRSRAGSGDAAVAALRNVLTHAEHAPTRLAFTVLAARTFGLTPQDAMALVGVPQAQRNSPGGLLAAGLVALRAGAADTAAALLAQGSPVDDGLHLFAQALARLQGTQPDAMANAADLLTRLAADYPSSSLAKNAGSFARQLGPRAASAPPSPLNR